MIDRQRSEEERTGLRCLFAGLVLLALPWAAMGLAVLANVIPKEGFPAFPDWLSWTVVVAGLLEQLAGAGLVFAALVLFASDIMRRS